MKLIPGTLLAVCLSASLLSQPGCSKKPDETAAVDALRTQLNEAAALQQKAGAATSIKEKIALAAAAAGQVKKLAQMPTEELPADLKSAMEEGKELFKKALGTLPAELQNLPSDQAAATQWVEDLARNPAKLLTIGPALKDAAGIAGQFKPEIEAWVAKLKPLATKYALPADFVPAATGQ